MRTKKFIVILLCLTMVVGMCGFTWKPISVVMDTKAHRIYKYITADQLLEEAVNGMDTVPKGYYCVTGKVTGKKITVGNLNDSFLLVGEKQAEFTIECDEPLLASSAMKAKVSDLQEDTVVNVYGKANVKSKEKKIRLTVEKLVIGETVIDKVSSPETYILVDDDKTMMLDYQSMEVRKLHDNKITYRIPKEWAESEGVEVDIRSNDLGEIEGYMYSLNKLSAKTEDGKAETFFVCYFDNETMLRDWENTRYSYDKIMSEIAENIIGKKTDKPSRVDTYYGAQYYYIRDDFRKSNVEFIFQPVDKEGYVVYLYVYQDKKDKLNYLDDIMFVTRFLEK